LGARPKKGRNLEHSEQVLLFQRAKLAVGRYPELALLYAVPNFARLPRAAWAARYMAERLAEGVRPGFPDVGLPVARCGFSALFVELKTEEIVPSPRTGKPTRKRSYPRPDQVDMIERLRKAGNAAVVCWGAEHAFRTLVEYLDGRFELPAGYG
jgi:hypothetical protein